MHRTLQQILRALLLDTNVQNWTAYLPHVAMAINSTVNVSTQATPYELVYGQNITLPIDLALGTHQVDPRAANFVSDVQ